MNKIGLFCLFFLIFTLQAKADLKKEVEFLKNKDCKNFFIENKKTKKENQKFKKNETVFLSLQAYAIGREAGAYKDCYNDLKKSIQLRHQAIDLIKSIKRPDEAVLQQLATSYQMLGYDYNSSGDIENGIKFLERGLKIDEENFYEKNYESISTTYNVLGFWYTNLYNYKKGEEYQKKYLNYVKVSKGETSKEYFNSFFYLGQDYISAGKYKNAINIFLELEKKIKTFNLEPLELVGLKRAISLAYYRNQDFALQRKYLESSLSVLNQNENVIDKKKFINWKVLILNDLGLSYSNTHFVFGDKKNLDLAEKYYLNSISISKAENINNNDTHITLGNLAGVYQEKGDLKKAIEYQLKSLKLCQSNLSKYNIECLKQMNALGHSYFVNKDMDKSLQLLKDAIQNEPNDFGSFKEYKISNRNLLALVYQDKGNFELAEKYLLEAISFWDPQKPQNYLAYFDTLNSLYNLYYSTGRLQESEDGYKELLKLNENRYGPDSPQLITSLNGLSLNYVASRKYKEAIEAISRAIKILETKTPNHSLKGTLYHNLAYSYSSKGDTKMAEKTYEIAIGLRTGGKGYDDVISHVELAKNKLFLKKYNEAKTLLDKALSVADKRMGANHPVKAYIFQRYAELYYLDKQIDQYIKNFYEFYQLVSSHANGVYGDKYSVKKSYFVEPINTTFDSLNLFSEEQYKYLVTNFNKYSDAIFHDAIIELSEISRTTTINQSVKNLIERSTDPKVAQLKKEYQNLVISYEKAKKFSNNDSEKKIIFRNLSDLKNKIFEKRKDILKTINSNDQNIFINKVSVARIQSKINPDEILIAYYFTANNLHVAIIDNNKIEFQTLQTNDQKVNELIKKIRASLVIEDNYKIKDFNVLQSRILFNEILNPILKKIDGKKNLIIIPHKSLLSLPFELLIDEEGISKNTDYKNIKWLINKFNISYYPSINSFYSLRAIEFNKTPKDFIGFGDPKFKQVVKADDSIIKYSNFFLRSGIANKNELLKFDELPETRDELSFLSKVFKSGSDLYLGNDFNERQVKSLKLDQYRVISFATHAILANEVNNIAEPAIVLTPPDNPDEFDDGVLTVSEIQKLKLNADTVILSACNTAGKDGTANAEGLSGLASAFFHAGSKSLMVTHWAVETNSTVDIMTNTFKNFEKGGSLSSALSEAKRQMIKNEAKSHPFFWAPFIIVGDNSKKI